MATTLKCIAAAWRKVITTQMGPAAAQSAAAASSAGAAPEQRRRNATERSIMDRLDQPDHRDSRHTERRLGCVKYAEGS
jgi:hypothetical protein